MQWVILPAISWCPTIPICPSSILTNPSSSARPFPALHYGRRGTIPNEMFAAGVYPNQNRNVEGLPLFIADRQPIANRDLVLWYTIGFRHETRSEDWPVMPGMWHSFKLRPFNFFDRNPGLDVPDAVDAQK